MKHFIVFSCKASTYLLWQDEMCMKKKRRFVYASTRTLSEICLSCKRRAAKAINYKLWKKNLVMVIAASTHLPYVHFEMELILKLK